MAFLDLRMTENLADFDEMIPALFSAFEKTTYLRIVFYIDSDPSKKEECLQAAISSTKASWCNERHSHWMKVVNSSGKLIAASNWMIFDSPPYTKLKPPIAVWWPEGEGRKYAGQYLWQATAHKLRLFNRPHVYLNICFTVKEWARRGAASIMLQCGVEEADRRGYDSFVEATEESKGLYERFGFIWFDTIHIDNTTKEPSEAWKKLQQDLPPEPLYLMWRPVRGRLSGTYLLPWGQILPSWAHSRYNELAFEKQGSVPPPMINRRLSFTDLVKQNGSRRIL